MKVLHICTSDHVGGAARAAYRLHSGLVELGVDSSMLVYYKQGNDKHIYTLTEPLDRLIRRIVPRIEQRIARKRIRQENGLFSTSILPSRVRRLIRECKPDILNLHWVNGGFLNIETIKKLEIPVVWTLHDMWPFTGGCHYAGDCDGYSSECGYCPVLKSPKKNGPNEISIANDLSFALQVVVSCEGKRRKEPYLHAP